MTASEALDSLDAVKCFAKIHRDRPSNVMLNEINRKSGNSQLEKIRQSTIHKFFKNCSYYN